MKYIFPVSLALVAIVLGIVYLTKDADPIYSEVESVQESAPAEGVTETPTEPEPPTQSGTSGYTMAQIAAHADASSCWTAIRGKVYDLTPWIQQHPGGSKAILSLCGRDGTTTFEGQHEGQNSPERRLTSFFIGDLSS